MLVRTGFLTAAALALSLPLFGQIGRGSISGLVRDSSDAVVAGAQVDIINAETNTLNTLKTNEAGLFTGQGLTVGHYDVKVTANGFRQTVRSGIELRVDDRVELDFQLQVGASSESVQVSAEAPLVDTAGATVGKVIDTTRIDSLPINGRSTLALVVLTPNVRSLAINSAGFADRGSVVSSFSVNGGPPGANNIVIDGSTNINPRDQGATVNPAVDAIQEFKVQSGTMAAEYGYTLGGVVNMVTKSGTNQFHGSLYEFLRNNDLDARNTFAAVKAPYRYNQFGGAVGGPIRKDHTFFFYNYEGWDYHFSYTVLNTVPTIPERTGDLSSLLTASGALIPVYDPNTTQANPSGGGFVRNLFPGNIIPKSRLDPVAQNVLNFFPLPNNNPNNAFAQTNNLLENLGSIRTSRQMTLKLDEHFSERNALVFHYMLWDHKDDNGANGSPIWPAAVARDRNDDYSNRNFNLTDTHTFSPTLINEFRLGVVRNHFRFASAAAGGDWTEKLGLPASVPDLTMPAMAIQGFPTFPAGNASIDGLISFDTFQLSDSLTWVYGKHILKAGIDERRNRYNLKQCNTCSGSFSFNSTLTGNPQVPAGTGAGLASFELGAVASASVDVTQPITYQQYTQAYFVQDEWRVTRRLTLNLGLRYDYEQPIKETHNRLSNFNPFAINPQNHLPGELEYAGVNFGASPLQPDYHDFSPRFGFAYDVTGDGKTAIRGGYGIYYAFTFMGSFFPTTTGFGSSTTTYSPAGGNTQIPAFQLQQAFPTPPVQPLGAALGPSAFQGQNVTFIQSDGRVPYSQQWNLTVQRQLPGQWLLEAGYSGNKGTRLLTVAWDYNQLDPMYLPMGNALQNSVPNPYSGIVSGTYGGATITRQQLLRPYPYYGNISVTAAREGSSIYHSWFLDIEKRMRHGFVVLASYSFGKLIDENLNAPSATGTEQINTGASYQSGKFNRAVERGLDTTDPAGRFVLSGVYELPFGAGKRWPIATRVVRAIVGGWQLDTSVVAEQGLPIAVRGANNNVADRPNSTGTSAVLGNSSAAQWFNTAMFVNPPSYTFGNVGRTLPDVRSPGAFTLDLSAIKNTRIRERLNLQFRAEAFNSLNRANLLAPNATFVPGPNGLNSSATFGTITSARDPRILQLALKLVF